MLISLKKLLIGRAAHLRSAPRGALLMVRDAWPDISRACGLPSTIQPYNVRRGRLILVCTSLLEAREISLRKDDIIREINNALRPQGVMVIKDLDFEVQT